MKKYILAITVLFALGAGGCKKDFLSLEENPNNPSSTTPELTLSGAEVNTAFNQATGYPQYAVWSGYWTTSGNFVPSAAIQQFQFTNTNFTGVWNAIYANLTNYNNLYNTSVADPSLAKFQAIAMIMKAYGFEALVDNFNNVPYTQAFQPTVHLFPVYDKGIDIYHDLGKQLDAAIALINKSGDAKDPGSADVIFGGDMDAWKKFANTIKLRLAVRVSTKFPADPLIAGLAATAGEGYLDETVQAVVNPGYQNVLGKQSPFYAAYGLDVNENPTSGNSFYVANAYSVDLLKNFNDPRVARFYALTLPAGASPTDTPTVIRGNVFGDTKNTLPNSNTSLIGKGILKSSEQDAVLISSSEALFLQAEAAQKGLIPGNAQALYEKAITASFEAVDLTAAEAATYYSQAKANVGWASSSNKLQAIVTQKWISLNGLNPLEAYNEYRRTGYPNLPSSIDPAAVSPTLPNRIFYPLSEVTSNPDNVDKEGEIDPFTSKIFWAQ
jgi:hypothetical protein